MSRFGPWLFGPVQTRFDFDSLLVISQQPANHIPAVGASDFDIALPVDSHDRIVLDARGSQVAGVQLIIGHQSLQGLPGHLDKLHSCVRAEFLVFRSYALVAGDTAAPKAKA